MKSTFLVSGRCGFRAAIKYGTSGPFTVGVRGKDGFESNQSIVIDALKLHFLHADQVSVEGALVSERARNELRRCLSDVHAHIIRERVQIFVADVRRLSFVDSSAIRLFVDWISKAEESRYKVIFLIDRSTTWQRLSFEVLRSLAPASVEIQEKDAPASLPAGGRNA